MVVAEPLRSVEERNALVLQWSGLPLFVYRRLAHLKVVRRLDYEDAVSAGTLGLIRAAELWDESRGIQFDTYAFWAVRRSILTEANKVHIVHAPDYYFGDAPEGNEQRQRMALATRQRVGRIESNDPNCPFDFPTREVDLDLPDWVAHALSLLEEQERKVVELRIYGGLSHADIACRLRISKQRAWQVYRHAIDRIRRREEMTNA